MAILKIRHLADRSRGTTEQRAAADPDWSPGPADGVWPSAGMTFEEGVPDEIVVSQRWLQTAAEKGWVDIEGSRFETAPAGPPHAPYAQVHVFLVADRVTFRDAVHGEIGYEVTAHPGKDDDGVSWTFELAREA